MLFIIYDQKTTNFTKKYILHLGDAWPALDSWLALVSQLDKGMENNYISKNDSVVVIDNEMQSHWLGQSLE